MKRFFPSVPRDVSSKKLASSDTQSAIPLPLPLVVTNGDPSPFPTSSDDCHQLLKDPFRFMSWNANSFILRLRNNREELAAFLQRIDPHVIAIQEVRIPAAGRKGEPKNQGEMKDDTKAARDDKQFMIQTLSRPPFASYKVWWSLADTKYGGTALLVKKDFEPLSVRYTFDLNGNKHETDGRVILAEFSNFYLMNTYVPNNGWKDEELSFQRRRKWDQRILDFVAKRSGKPLIWCGDLNVSLEEIDVSHPEFFKTAKLQGYVPPRTEDIGQPGFTQSERDRFSKILKDGDLIDTYRWLHKQKNLDGGFTWSGHPIGKYRGKRMRIDYFLISRELLPKLAKSEIHGHGIEMEGFYGSDHCPITMDLSWEPTSTIIK